MKPLPLNPDLLHRAPRVIWFEPAEQALANPVRFVAYVMAYGTLEDILVVKRYLDLDDFRETLDHAPPGIIDARSWSYWNAVVGRYPAPPMPRRVIPGHDPSFIELLPRAHATADVLALHLPPSRGFVK